MGVFLMGFFNSCDLTSSPPYKAAFVDLEQENTIIFYFFGKY